MTHLMKRIGIGILAALSIGTSPQAGMIQGHPSMLIRCVSSTAKQPLSPELCDLFVARAHAVFGGETTLDPNDPYGTEMTVTFHAQFANQLAVSVTVFDGKDTLSAGPTGSALAGQVLNTDSITRLFDSLLHEVSP